MPSTRVNYIVCFTTYAALCIFYLTTIVMMVTFKPTKHNSTGNGTEAPLFVTPYVEPSKVPVVNDLSHVTEQVSS